MQISLKSDSRRDEANDIKVRVGETKQIRVKSESGRDEASKGKVRERERRGK